MSRHQQVSIYLPDEAREKIMGAKPEYLSLSAFIVQQVLSTLKEG